eukprot:scaffold34374_cov60-Phaeocystis_antarctica.AAC.1
MKQREVATDRPSRGTTPVELDCGLTLTRTPRLPDRSSRARYCTREAITQCGSVSYWAHCVAFYDFWERENSLEKKLRCGKAKKGSGRI